MSFRPSEGSLSVRMIPYAPSLRSRSANMFVAILSWEPRNSLNLCDPSNIMSRMISSDQRSPSISSEAFSGQPDRHFGFLFAIVSH